jgi:crotonobetainyl-CoA:carnitine CoA-transferase CaiB-like acyl-CoA transferase
MTRAVYPEHQPKQVRLNLRTSVGRDLAFALASQADIVVEGFRPGVMHHLGLDFDSLRRVKRDLVYCSITGYGHTGPMVQLGGHDLNIQAVSGFLSTACDAKGTPIVGTLPISEYACGLFASEQICAALVHRMETGRGVRLDVAALDLMADWMSTHMWLAGIDSKQKGFPASKGRINYQVYETADGRYVALAAVEEKYWLNFCHAIGRDDWELLADLHIEAHPEIYEEMKALFLTRTQAEWHELGSEVDCCLTAVEELDSWAELPTSDSTPSAQRKRAARDTYEVLASKLNCSSHQLEQYAKDNIIPQRE